MSEAMHLSLLMQVLENMQEILANSSTTLIEAHQNSSNIEFVSLEIECIVCTKNIRITVNNNNDYLL